MNQTLYLLSSIAGMGKSTYANKLASQTGAIIICPDTIRGELSGNGDESDQTHNAAIFNTILPQRIVKAFIGGYSVILDSMNLKIRDRKRWMNIAREHKFSVECHFIRPNLAIALKQNKMRSRNVPEDIIQKQFNNWHEPDSLFEKFDKIVEVSRE